MRPISLLTCLIIMMGLSPAAQAESPWRSLARFVSPQPVVQPVDNKEPASYQSSLAQMQRTSESVDGQDMTDAGLAAQPGAMQAGISGLAIAGGSSKSSIDLGLESDDQGDFLATDLFRRPEIRKLIGDEPRFIYDSSQRPDPMLVPWVRRTAIFKELSSQAKQAMDSEDFQTAADIYTRIIGLDDERYNGLARAQLAAIKAMENDIQVAEFLATQVMEKEPVVELPAWVVDNTTGVIIEPGSGVCLIGDFVLSEGQSLPNYPEITVAAIENKRVVYQIQDQSFEVNLDN